MIHSEQRLWTKEKGWELIGDNRLKAAPQIVFAFGARSLLEDWEMYHQIRNFYHGAYIVSCSTAGEISDTRVTDGSIAVTALHFEKSLVRFVETRIDTVKDSLNVGKRLAEFLPVEGLVHAMVFAEGLEVNGSLLVRGINDNLPVQVAVTGGLVADGTDFKKTVVGRDGPAESRKVVLIGYYGDALRVGFGSFGGWKGMGEKHTITKSEGNVLYEIDGKPALSVYTDYLGDRVKELPGSALLYPLQLHMNGLHHDVVRTVLGVDQAAQSMTFAGDMPVGVEIEFMRTELDDLVAGAGNAAKLCMNVFGVAEPEFALLVSCVGRKLVLRDRTADELASVRSIIGRGAAMTGFYSYGEICPSSYEDKQCLLHNQTMTITAFREL